MATQVASLYGTIDLVDNFTPGLTSVLGGVDNFTSKITSAGSLLTGFGVGLGATIAPLAGAFTLATNNALGFTEQLANIQSITQQSDADIAALGETLLGLDNRFTGQQTAGAFYDIVGSVADASTHMAILDSAIETAIAGNADLTGTTSALTSTMNSYGFAASEAGFASDVLTRTVGMGVGTMDQFAAALPSVTGLASELSIHFAQLGGMAAFLTTKGNTASEATTQLSAIMSAFMKPNEAMKDGLEELGFASGSAAIEQLGLVGALRAVSSGGIAQEEGFAALLGTQEALRGSTALLGNDYSAFINDFITGVDGATASAYAFQTSNPAYEFQRLKAQISDTATAIGMALLPALNNVMAVVGPILDTFSAWIDRNPKLVLAMATLTFGLVGLAGAATVGGVLLTGLGMALGLLFSPLGIVIGLVAVAGAAFATNFLGIRDAMEPVINVLGLFADGVSKTFELLLSGRNVFDSLRNGMGFFVDDMARALGFTEKQARGIQKAFMDVTRFIQSGDWSGLGKMIKEGLIKAIPEFNKFWSELRESAPAAMEAVGGMIGDIARTIGEKMADIGSLIAEHGPKVIAGLVILTGLIGLWAVNTAIPELAGLAWDMASSFALGFMMAITNNGVGMGGFTAAILGAISALPAQAAALVTDFGPQLLGAMAGSVGDGATWTSAHLIAPIAGALINPANWAMAASTGQIILTQMALIGIDGTGWVLTHITFPIVSALISPTNWIMAAAALGIILNQMGLVGVDALMWSSTHIIVPVVSELINPANWATASGVLGIIFASMGLVAVDVLAWTTGHIILPIVSALIDPNNWAWAAGVLAIIMGILGQGVANVAGFVNDKIVNPIKNALSAAYNSIAQAINDLFPDELRLDFGSITLNIDMPHPFPDINETINFGSYSMSLGNPVPMRAMGGPVLGGHPYIVGERGPEMIVPRNAGEVIPNHELGGGGRGGITIYGDVTMTGVNDIETMYDELMQVQANRGA